MLFLPLSVDLCEPISKCGYLEYAEKHSKECGFGHAHLSIIKETAMSKMDAIKDAASASVDFAKKYYGKASDYFSHLKNKWSGSTSVVDESVLSALHLNGEKVKELAGTLRSKLKSTVGNMSVVDAVTIAWFVNDIVKSPDKTGTALVALDEAGVGPVAKDVLTDSSMITSLLSTHDDIARKNLMESLSQKLGFSNEQLYLLTVVMLMIKSLPDDHINISGLDKTVMLEN
jgi:hypothetical protein